LNLICNFSVNQIMYYWTSPETEVTLVSANYLRINGGEIEQIESDALVQAISGFVNSEGFSIRSVNNPPVP
jgi:hypothetical protein